MNSYHEPFGDREFKKFKLGILYKTGVTIYYRPKVITLRLDITYGVNSTNVNILRSYHFIRSILSSTILSSVYHFVRSLTHDLYMLYISITDVRIIYQPAAYKYIFYIYGMIHIIRVIRAYVICLNQSWFQVQASV